jgi:hypothetical protein
MPSAKVLPPLFALVVGAAQFAAAPAVAEPVLHHVKYTVGASQPLHASIYYRQVDPPDFAAYSHNPYEYSPKAMADLGPGKPWVLETTLADPDAWAMVVVSAPEFHPGLEPPGFVCELRVDGEVKATNAGAKGALCSIRNW